MAGHGHSRDETKSGDTQEYIMDMSQCPWTTLNTEVKSGRKQGRPGNTYHVNDVRWTHGGRHVNAQITH